MPPLSKVTPTYWAAAATKPHGRRPPNLIISTYPPAHTICPAIKVIKREIKLPSSLRTAKAHADSDKGGWKRKKKTNARENA
ncbi:hypothetical protein EVAR_103618_1 [Eumeta japonica]|uniref:Uncharacterized protein n=1 Tax=Eumeta variegata TaxID=151549 RepID=A0A4C1T6G4_EUMVA|nr:hypothetical protein EVAR_103618_1 [Eumeta japonica]